MEGLSNRSPQGRPAIPAVPEPCAARKVLPGPHPRVSSGPQGSGHTPSRGSGHREGPGKPPLLYGGSGGRGEGAGRRGEGKERRWAAGRDPLPPARTRSATAGSHSLCRAAAVGRRRDLKGTLALRSSGRALRGRWPRACGG